MFTRIFSETYENYEMVYGDVKNIPVYKSKQNQNQIKIKSIKSIAQPNT